MARVDTWMPIYWGDYTKDTGHLGAVHHGAYLMLIKHYWTHAEALPADDTQLWRIACTDSLAHWRKIKAVVLAFFEERDGRLHHARVDKEMAKAGGNADRREEMARRAADARWKQERARRTALGMPGAMRGECPLPSSSDNPQGNTSTDAASAAGDPAGPPRSQPLPESAKWRARLDGYKPWLPHGDPQRGRWSGMWGLSPDSAGLNKSIPAEMLKAWKALYADEMAKLRSAA